MRFFFVFVDIVHTLFVIELRALLLANSLIRLLLHAGLTVDLEERYLGHTKLRAGLGKKNRTLSDPSTWSGHLSFC